MIEHFAENLTLANIGLCFVFLTLGVLWYVAGKTPYGGRDERTKRK
jgi:hypothetical protein